jgi:hypothetical protein
MRVDGRHLRAVDPAGGLTPDALLDLDGFRNVLALRVELRGYRGERTPATGRYYDPQYYERALAALNGGAAKSPVARS